MQRPSRLGSELRPGGTELGPATPTRIGFDRYSPEDQRRRESLLGLGNGLLFMRACAPEAAFAARNEDRHYAGLYAAGVYNRAQREINGEHVRITSLANLPNPFALSFRAQTGAEPHADWFRLDACELLHYEHRLDMAAGLALREVVARDPQGHEWRVSETRLLSMARPELALLDWRVTPLNWSGSVCVRALVFTTACNALVSRMRAYEGQHLNVRPIECDDGLAVLASTTDGKHRVCIRARLRSDNACGTERGQLPGALWQQVRSVAQAGEPFVVRLWVEATFGGSVPDGPLPVSLAAVFAEQRAAWDALWREVSIRAPANAELERGCRFGAFHLLQTASPLSASRDVGLPARGWQEAYFGHVFWDDLAAFPFYSLRFPMVARGMLMYRVHRLDQAIRAARRAGWRGAMFPWRSATTGEEETPPYQWIPTSRRWKADHTHLQHHVGCAIALNIWRHHLATGDRELLVQHTGRMLLEIARFWAGRAEHDADSGRFRIRGVIGPDEYHDAYPGAVRPGLDDNAYTNVMASWTLRCALELPGHLDSNDWASLAAQTALQPSELDGWDEVSRRLTVPLLDDDVIAQFDGFDRLESAHGGPLRKCKRHPRTDWWLDAQGDDINAYQATKQADVLMLLHVLGHAQLQSLLERLGYRLAAGWYERTVRYYLARITHESSLSRFVCAGALACIDGDASWGYFRQALRTDLDPGPSTHEGLHLGAMAGTWDVLQRHYFGLEIEPDRLLLNPYPPMALDDVTIQVQVRGSRVRLHLQDRWIHVRIEDGPAAGLLLEHRDELHRLVVGCSLKLARD